MQELGSLKDTRNCTIRYTAYEFPLAFHYNYVPTLYRLRYSEILVENCRFQPTHLYLRSPLGGNPHRNFAQIFGARKLDFLHYSVAFFA